jgi:hypothetical protein
MCIEKIFTVTAVTSDDKKILGAYKFIEDCIEQINVKKQIHSDVIEWIIESYIIGSANSGKVQQVFYMQEHISV